MPSSAETTARRLVARAQQRLGHGDRPGVPARRLGPGRASRRGLGGARLDLRRLRLDPRGIHLGGARRRGRAHGPVAAGRRAHLWLLASIYGLFLVSGIAQGEIVPLLPRLSSAYGLTPPQTALLLALPGLATVAVSLPAGLAADRFGARRVTLAAAVLLTLACLGQALPSLPGLLIGRGAFGIAFGVIWTTGVAWLSEIDAGGGAASLGPSVTCASVGMMIGPALGGVLSQRLGLGAPFVVTAVTGALVLAALVALRREARACEARASAALDRDQAPVAGRAASGEAGPLGRLRAVVRRPGVAAAAGGLIVSGGISATVQLLISSGLHADGLPAGAIGLCFSAAAVTYIAVSALVVRAGARARTRRVNAAATAVAALGLLPALVGGSAAALVAALVLTSAPRAAISTIAYALAAGGGGDDGAVFGLVNGGWAAANVLAPVLAGAAEQHGGPDIGYLVVILPAAAIALALLLGLVRGRRVAPATAG